MPLFLDGQTPPEACERWLDREAIAHVKRDRARGMTGDMVSRPIYKKAIHEAVILSDGRDAYTGEKLDWHLISKYDNDRSKAGHQYKAQFALLPSVDHVDAGAKWASFRICAWRTNDAKNDRTIEAIIALCRLAVSHAERADGVSPIQSELR